MNKAVVFFWAFVVAFLCVGLAIAPAIDRDQNSDPAIKEWFRSLMQPDNPAASCCGESDGYWADEVHVKDGKVYATVTDNRDLPGRTPLNGLVVEIPPNKMMDGKQSKGNPTGHNYIFLSSGGSIVYCFIMGTLG